MLRMSEAIHWIWQQCRASNARKMLRQVQPISDLATSHDDLQPQSRIEYGRIRIHFYFLDRLHNRRCVWGWSCQRHIPHCLQWMEGWLQDAYRACDNHQHEVLVLVWQERQRQEQAVCWPLLQKQRVCAWQSQRWRVWIFLAMHWLNYGTDRR